MTTRDAKGSLILDRLDRLRDKAGRYESHKSFLEKCITENVIPNGLKLELEPTIGNHDEEFISNFYLNYNRFEKNL